MPSSTRVFGVSLDGVVMFQVERDENSLSFRKAPNVGGAYRVNGKEIYHHHEEMEVQYKNFPFLIQVFSKHESYNNDQPDYMIVFDVVKENAIPVF